MTTKPHAGEYRSARRFLLSLSIAGLLTLTSAPVNAFNDDFNDFDDFGQDLMLLQMQREAIASQEEQAREAGRVQRRKEVEKFQEKLSGEHEQYFQSILETSQAALRAPRGAYYRKPGDTTQEPPGLAQSLEVDGVGYLYDQGVFWLAAAQPLTAVIGPVGAVVDKLPAGAYRLAGKEPARYYYFGVFYQEKSGKFEVIKPPAGLLVSYLPDGYQTEVVQGKTIFSFGATHFKPVFVQGVLVYQVIEP
jgi:hypothetical protein